MLGRSIVIVALAAYVSVVGCVVWPGGPGSSRYGAGNGGNGYDATPNGGGPTGAVDDPRPPSRRTVRLARYAGLPYRGVAMQVQRVDQVQLYERSIDEVIELGADTVSLVVDARQENGSSSRIFMDLRMTPSAEQLSHLIRYAKGRKLRVVLMPIVLLDKPRGTEWRGTIKPESWENWFQSYREMITHYAAVAQATGVDVFVVGSELVSTQDKVEQWRRTIREVRKLYKGKTTYSANWDNYTKVPFWDQLDLIGMNSYWKLGDDRNVAVEEIKRRWYLIQNDLFTFVHRTGKPLLLLEAGWCSLSNAAHEPWDYTRTELQPDAELQRKLYQGFFESWHGRDEMAGFMIWEWPPGNGGVEDRGYTPEGKPAQEVMREWMSKPWK